MLDGFIARKSKNESKIGARLDSASDITFAAVQEGHYIRTGKYENR